MNENRFDPLRDRPSRLIRNRLSEAFADALAALDLDPVRRVAAEIVSSGSGPVYLAYVEDRLDRYRRALDLLAGRGRTSALDQALVLWDLALFFEVHEVLERAWLAASGREKTVLQAMIRAAGVYVHLGQDNPAGARKMAARAAAALRANQDLVPPALDLDRLLGALDRVDPEPPRLAGKSLE